MHEFTIWQPQSALRLSASIIARSLKRQNRVPLKAYADDSAGPQEFGGGGSVRRHPSKFETSFLFSRMTFDMWGEGGNGEHDMSDTPHVENITMVK